MEKIFAVVVTFNGLKWLDRCLCSLLSSDIPVSVIVVDNASTDGTPERIVADFPSVHLIRSRINYGFAKANNIGIRYALDNGADYVFLLNQDAWVASNTVGMLLNTLSTIDGVGIVSPVHLNGAGCGLDKMFASYMPSDFISDSFMGHVKNVYDVRFVNAASWLVSRKCIVKVGGFDTSVFVHYGEDDNFCQRVRFHGFRIVVNTVCTICHDRDQRSTSEDEYRHRVFKTPDLSRRIELADVNKGYDISALISVQKKLWWRKILTFRISAARIHTKEMKFLSMIGESRRVNISGGLNWL